MSILFSMDALLLLVGFILLTVGADVLVRGASRLAVAIGISPLVVGLTVVAFGTSAPEMAVSTVSGLTGQTNIALGNVVGSNIFNVLLILGLSALIVPLTVSRQLIRLDVPLMIGASVLVFLFGLNGQIGRGEGLILLGLIIAYTIFQIVQSRREHQQVELSIGEKSHSLWIDALMLAGGLALLVLGTRWLVNGAVAIAGKLGVSELVIGLTVVACGTSLPELATSVVASIRGQREIAVGNVVGSNMFNLLAVLGLAGLVSPDGVPVSESVLRFDFPVMLAVSVACFPVFFTGSVIARWEGALFFGYYIAYTVFLVLSAAGRPEASGLGFAMLWFVIPLTVLTLVLVSLREIRRRRAAGL
ncbi:MAG: calcium/sodium antiporter [Kiritimatiellales bacterium]